MKVTAHKMVAQLAKEMAEETYEMWASRNNQFYANVPSSTVWVMKNWMLFIDPAREALAKMLGSNEYDEHSKNKIYEALIKDNEFKHARARAVRGDTVNVEIDW